MANDLTVFMKQCSKYSMIKICNILFIIDNYDADDRNYRHFSILKLRSFLILIVNIKYILDFILYLRTLKYLFY